MGEKWYPLAASHRNKLLLWDARLAETVDGFAIGDYNGTGFCGDAIGSRQTWQAISMLCMKEASGLLVKVSMGDEDVVCLCNVIHGKILGQNRGPFQPGVQEDGDTSGTKAKRCGACMSSVHKYLCASMQRQGETSPNHSMVVWPVLEVFMSPIVAVRN